MFHIESGGSTHTLQECFRGQVQRAPDRLCIRVPMSKGENAWELSYGEIDRWSDSLAARLQVAGVVSGDYVGLCVDRSAAAIAAMLAVVKIGACYVPLSPDYPEARIKLMVEDIGLKVAYATSISTNKMEQVGVKTLLLEERPLLDKDDTILEYFVGQEDDPAYIIFTSGSTGRPKGVVVPHRGILRLVSPENSYCRFDQDRRFLQLAPLFFDAATFEIWGPLLNGACCVVLSGAGMPHSTMLAKVLLNERVTTMWLTSSLYNTIISEHPECLKPLKQLLIGGEALSIAHVRKGLEELSETQIINGYGPTENTTFTTAYPIPRNLPEEINRIPIGFPINSTHCGVFDSQLNPVVEGESGELITFGNGLAIEYINQPELTAERFIEMECSDGVKRRGYRTGDLVVKLENGSYDYLQRNDMQVKIDGHRIEPGEIELFLNKLDQLTEARVLVKTGPQDKKRLVAYVVGESILDPHVIRKRIADELPNYMVPHFIIPLSRLPKNENGKLDEDRLPDPFLMRQQSKGDNQQIADCWQQVLGRGVEENENFLEAGGTSLEALQLTELFEKCFNRQLEDTFVFEYPTISAQARFFDKEYSQNGESTSIGKDLTSGHEIAVIGMACRFPGASDLEEFWDNLIHGKESISFFDDDELSNEVNQTDRSNPNYVRAKGIIEDCDQFDAAFFGISPAEAEIMDPQQRVMLQLAWHALENAGYPFGDDDQLRTGVFTGTNWNRYFQQYVLNSDDIKSKFGLFNASLANEADFLSTRISYKLNLTGPSLNVFTACSTGLVAISQACSSIERGECEMSLAGGVSISTPLKSGYMYQEGSMLSRDGHCRPFDIQSTGTTFNDGAGFVVMKRLDLALRDNDRIYAVVKGFEVNNDGANKASFTAPSIAGQVGIYDATLAKAGILPDTIGFIETHGTATPLGDPIEVRALSQSYSRSRKNTSLKCAIGSVKSNIGHTIHAAGVAGFIKAVMVVNKGLIPPTLHFTKQNPKLDLENTPFYVNNTLEKWSGQLPRRAAVSALGVGGTNAHVIVEQYNDSQKENTPKKTMSAPHPASSILLSAKDKQSLEMQISQYALFFKLKPSNYRVADAAYTSFVARQHFQYRIAISGSSAAEIANKLEDKKQFIISKAVKKNASIIGFMFSGQGSQRQLMGYWLYQNNEDFRKLIDQGSEIILAQQGFDPRVFMINKDKQQDNEFDVNQTKFAQPLLFLFEYGLARYLQSCGCSPTFFIGHSIGEFTAAALAEVFTFEEALELVAARGALMQSMPAGKMLTVKATAGQVKDLLGTDLCLAGVNAPDRIVLSGPEEKIQAAMLELSNRNFASSILHTSHAFHSVMMEPIVSEFKSLVDTMDLNPPTLPIFSTATGTLLTDEQAMDSSYWAMQLRQSVLFSDAITAVRELYSDQSIAFVEVGPGRVLSSLVACQNAKEKNTVLGAAPSSGIDDEFVNELSQCLNNLWASGFEINWSMHYNNMDVTKTRLPGYAFLPNVHWLLSPTTMTQNKSSAEQMISAEPKQIKKEIQEITMSAEDHRHFIEKKLRELLEDVTGFDLSDVDAGIHFSEVGLDSLLLTQVATAIEGEFSIGISFRHLVEEYTTIAELSDFVADKVPPETKQITVESTTPAAASASQLMLSMPQSGIEIQSSDAVNQLIQQQLQVMQLQLQALGNNVSTQSSIVSNESSSPKQSEQTTKEKTATRHTPGTRITREQIGVSLTKAQQLWIDEVMANYQKKYAKSKQYTQEHRKYFADPRSVSGFNPEWKEIIFPIVTKKSKGSKLWDIDGNELIDTANGFGPIFFGHSPDFITNAIKQQLDLGIETGPQSPLAGEVAKLFCELTGNERCTFASTGSEAVMGAIRLARTVTGRKKIAMFDHNYHGIFDEVINRPGKDYQALPAAPGINREMTSNMLILPWGDPESLEVLKTLAPELAAVLVEPVQSRMPEFHDKNYLKEIRSITLENGTAMILDEVVTGFRVHPGGIRKHFDIDADLATYGKVIGGGYPIGIIGGKAKFMDALDGGYWEFGDDSIPECGVTFFAGTFVRHPLALVAAKAVMERIKAGGTELYDGLEKKTATMSGNAKMFIDEMKCDVTFEEFASLFYVSAPANAHWGHMLFMLMTLEGIHIQQFRPNFLTTEHSEEDIAKILKAFKKSLAKLIFYGLIEGDTVAAKRFLNEKPKIPEGARLGKNAQGEPAYFIEDPNNNNKYIEVGRP